MISRKTIKKFSLFCGVGLALLLGFFIFEAAESRPLSAQVVEEEPLSTEETQDDAPDILEKRQGRAYVTIKVKDDTWSRVRVERASLEGRRIRLQKRPNIFGQRGTLNARLAPGEYTVRWTVTKPAVRGHRITLSFRKTFTVSKRSNRVTVVINGQNATVY